MFSGAVGVPRRASCSGAVAVEFCDEHAVPGDHGDVVVAIIARTHLEGESLSLDHGGEHSSSSCGNGCCLHDED